MFSPIVVWQEWLIRYVLFWLPALVADLLKIYSAGCVQCYYLCCYLNRWIKIDQRWWNKTKHMLPPSKTFYLAYIHSVLKTSVNIITPKQKRQKEKRKFALIRQRKIHLCYVIPIEEDMKWSGGCLKAGIITFYRS